MIISVPRAVSLVQRFVRSLLPKRRTGVTTNEYCGRRFESKVASRRHVHKIEDELFCEVSFSPAH